MTHAQPISAYGLPGPLRALIERFQDRRARTTADRSLALRLKDALTREGTDLRGLSFYVDHGAVAVYGSVPGPAAREALLGLVAKQPGVTRIVDHLRIAPQPAVVRPPIGRVEAETMTPAAPVRRPAPESPPVPAPPPSAAPSSAATAPLAPPAFAPLGSL